MSLNKDQFLNPKSAYYGNFSPERLAFNANLQEFSTRIGYIVNLETGGKLAPEDAYKQIKALFKELKKTKKGLLSKEE